MFTLKLQNNPEKEIRSLIAKFAELPRSVARKHLQAAMRRTIKDAVPVLRSVTPPIGGTRGRRKKGVRATGALRRSVTTKAKYIGKTSSGAVYGVVGYKASFESRKAIWLQYGTSRGIQPRRMLEQLEQAYAGPSLEKLKTELAAALEKAAADLGRSPGA